MAVNRSFGKIVVAFDGSPDSVRAVETGCILAQKFQSELVLVNVYTLPVYGLASPLPGTLPNFDVLEDAAKEKARKTLQGGMAVASKRGVKCRAELLEAPSVLQALVEFTDKEKPDLIVAGTRGMTGFKKMIVGSVSSGLVSHSKFPVLVVR